MRDRALTLALAVLALLLFCGLFVERKEEQKSSMASSVDIGEQGVAAVYHWLERRGVPISSWRKPWYELADSRPQGNVLLSFLPYRAQEEKTGTWGDSPGSYVAPRESQELVHWISAGNTYVMAMNAFDASGSTEAQRANERRNAAYFDLLNSIGWELQGTAINAWSETDMDGSDADETEENSTTSQQETPSITARPHALHKLRLQLTEQQTPLQFETKAWEVQGSKDLELKPTDVEADCRGEEEDDDSVDDDELSDEVVVMELTPPTNKSTQKVQTDTAQQSAAQAAELQRCLALGLKQAVVILRSAEDDAPAGWWLPLGRGGLVVLGYGSAWRNPNLNQPGSALALETLLRFYLEPGAEVLLDDAHYGLSSIYDPAALMKDARLYWTLSIAGLFWLLYAVGRSRRLLPVRTPKVRVSSASFARAITDFYARQLTDKELAEALIGHFLRHARRVLAIRNATDEQLWERLQSDSRLAQDDIAEIFSLSSGRDNVKLGQLLLRQHARLAR